MPDYLKISELPAASSVAPTDQIELNQSGTSRRITVGQLLGVGSAFGAVLTSNVAVGASSTVTLTGYTEYVDYAGTFNASTGVWTPTTAGTYRVSGFTSIDAGAANTVRLLLFSSATGGAVAGAQSVVAGASFTINMAFSAVITVTASTDYYLQVVTVSAVAATVLGNPFTHFNATYVGP